MATIVPRSDGPSDWSDILDQLSQRSPVREVILESWDRCRRARIDPDNAPLHRVSDDELARRLEASAGLIAATRPYLDWISALLASTPHVVYVTDADGVILLSTGTDPDLLRDAGLDPGHDWSENRMGTNAAGTTLVTGRPQAVVASEHYAKRFHTRTCTAAPIFGESGDVLGAIDISTASGEGAAERMLLVTHAARVIQRDLEAERTAAVAERWAAEAEDARRTLETLLEHIPEGITIASAPDVRILRVSRYGERLTGRTSPELTIPAGEAAHTDAWGLFRPDGTPARDDELPLTRAVRQGEVSTGEEWLLQRPDGTRLTILTNAGPIRDADGTITGGVIAWRDVSDRKEAEQQLRENETRMRELYEAAELAARQREEVIAIVSHDLRNPLNVILAATSLMTEVELPEEKKVKQASVITRSARTMLRLIEDLLDATRIQAGSLRIHREPLNPHHLIDEATSMLIPMMEDRRLSLRVEVEEDVPWFDADRVRLLQVLDNLLGNAIRHSPGGGTIHLHVRRNQDHLVFTVADQGPGIPENDRPHLFEKFWQGKGQSAGGAGLGLTICKGIIEAHGGRIWLDEDVPTGTAIRFELPT